MYTDHDNGSRAGFSGGGADRRGRWGLLATLAIVSLCLTTLVSASAQAATLQLHGLLRTSAGGPVVDGKYVLFARLYTDKAAKTPAWEHAISGVVVQGGMFHLTLGSVPGKTIADSLLVSGKTLWLGIQVGSESELERVSLGWVPRAYHAKSAASATFPYAASKTVGGAATSLACSGCVQGKMIATASIDATRVNFNYAGSATKGGPATSALTAKSADLAKKANSAEVAKNAENAAMAKNAALAQAAKALQCTGCVGVDQLSAAVATAYLSTSGGTVKSKVAFGQQVAIAGKLQASGGVDLGDGAIEGGRFAAVDIGKAPCSAKLAGRVAYSSKTSGLYLCNGSKYLRIKTCSGACKKPAEVPCGQAIVDDCGDIAGCKGTGSACVAGQVCSAAGCSKPGSAANPAASCAAILASNSNAASGLYHVKNAGQVWCDFTDKKAPVTLPPGVDSDKKLRHYYDFKAKPNYDFKTQKSLSISLNRYVKGEGLNLNNIGKQGASWSYSSGQTILIKARRKFGFSGQGMVFSTTDQQDDDGVTIWKDFIGGRTHGGSFQLRGTKLSNILPDTAKAYTFAMTYSGAGVRFDVGKGNFSSIDKSGSGSDYDSLSSNRFFLGSNSWQMDPWNDGDFIIEKLALFNAQLSNAQHKAWIDKLNNL